MKLTMWQLICLCALVVALLYLGAFRYHIAKVDGPYVTRLDRWTGKVDLIKTSVR